MPMFERYRHVHFVGIGGIGMSGLAEILLALGYRVSGSDQTRSDTVARLAGRGAKIFAGHDAAHVDDAHVVVYSSAVPPDNVEVVAARRRRIPTIPRGEMLAELMRRKYGVAVAGTHGKTTTTSMVGAVLGEAGYDPTIVVGGRVLALGSNARLGHGDFFVAEADESDGSFLRLSPAIAVVTTIDAEHLDHYGSLDAIRDAFAAFANRVPFYGSVVLCLDEPDIRRVLPRVERRVITYGLESSSADLVASGIVHRGLTTCFDVVHRDAALGACALRVPGRHNVANALAAVAVGLDLEVPFATIRTALGAFTGVERRFQVRGTAGTVTVIDDYGHHPAEIRATLAAARTAFEGRLVTVFQPHRYTRTRDLWDGFLTAFDQTDVLIVLDIYAAGEPPVPGVTAEALAEAIRAHGHGSVTYLGGPSRTSLLDQLVTIVRAGDVVLTLGAGDVGQLGPELLHRFESDPAHGRATC